MRDSITFIRTFLIPVDFLAIVFVFSSTYFYKKDSFSPLATDVIPSYGDYFTYVFIFSIIYLILFAFTKGYTVTSYLSLQNEITKLVQTSFIWIASIASYFFWTRNFFFSRFVLLSSLVFITLTLIAIRLIVFYLRRHYFPKQRVCIVGCPDETKDIHEFLLKTKHYEVQTSLKWECKEDTDILVLTEQNYSESNEEMIHYALVHHIRVFLYHKDLLRNNIHLNFEGLKVYEIFHTSLYGFWRLLKRWFDVCASFFGLVVLSPILFVISVLVKFTSRGSVFVGLKRVGRGNKEFTLYKFRSMVKNAHNLKQELMKHNERSDGPLFKMKNDPRITSLGKFLRKTRIDELPQLWNVLKGEMSLVGPRPHERNEVSKYTKSQKKLLSIKPGLTGMAQVSGASDLTFDEEFTLDMNYIENWNFWTDIIILVRTVWVILTGKGAA